MFFNQNPLEIVVNSRVIQPGEPIHGDINSIKITHSNGLQVHQGQGIQIMKYISDLIQRLKSDYVSYQGVLILKKEVKII